MYSNNLKTKMAKSVLKKCRTCLKSEKKFQSLEEQMDLGFIQMTYKEALIALTNIKIQVDQEEYMPRGICNRCSRKLRTAQEFIKQAQDANSELLSRLCSVQQPSLKPLDCLKEPPIDLDVNNYVQVKLEEEIGEPQTTSTTLKNNSTTPAGNILTIKKENISASKFEDFHECQEITKKDFRYSFDPVPIDPLPEDCSTGKCDDISQNNALIALSESSNLKKQKTRKSAKTKILKDDDLLPIGCEDCGKIYENAKHLARHRKSAHLPEELKIPCPNCGRKFSRKCNLYTHMRTFHGKESVEELLRPPDSLIARKKYQCEKCPCKYTNINKLRAHIRHKHDAAKEEVSPPKKTENKIKRTYTFLCTICGMSCSSQTVLRRHTLLHTGEKPFKCNICNKAYARSYDLVVHRRIHTGERPLKCNICSKTFSRSDVLADHIRSHSNERPYKCTQCERCFKRPKELTIHMRIHTGERPYTCGVCFNTFTQRISLKAHRMKYGHVETPNPDIKTKNTDNNTTATITSMPV